MRKFKIGDKVYCPTYDNLIHEINSYNGKGNLYIPSLGWFSSTGLSNNGMPTVFLATQENYELLSQLCPSVEFEKPPVRKTSREVIQAMLDDWGYVVCCVSDSIKSPDDKGYTELVYGLDNDNEYQFIGRCNNWRYATPFDLKTGKVIIDYVNGEIVTE